MLQVAGSRKLSIFVADSPVSTYIPMFLQDRANSHDLVVNGLIVSCLTVLLTVSDAFETGHYGISHQITLWATLSLLLVTQVYATKHFEALKRLV